MTDEIDWREQYDVDDDLADEIDRCHVQGLEALEYGLSREAVECFVWLVEQWARIAGIRGERTMVCRAFLARAFAADGQVRMAADELRRLIVDRAAVFGPDDPQTLRTRGQLGQVLARNGFVDEGIEVLVPLLEDRVRLFGEDDPSVHDTMGNLAEALLLGHWYADGRDLYEDLLDARTEALGADHPDTRRTWLNWMAARSKACDDPAEAIALLNDGVLEASLIDGPDSDTSLYLRGHIADAHLRNGDFDTAIVVLKALVKDRSQLLGRRHPDTRRSRRMLADARRWSAGGDA
jgi:hypothetical protein